MKARALIRHFLLATLGTLVVWSVVGGLLQAALAPPTTGSPAGELFHPLVAVTLLVVVLVTLSTWIVLRSHLQGRGLMGLLFGALYGVMFFMTQNETLVFNGAIGMPASGFALTLISGAAACLAAAWFGARLRGRLGDAPARATTTLHGLPALAAGFSVLALAYAALYFICGYFIAWQFAPLRAFYSGSTETLPFGAHIAGVLRQDSWLVPYQIVRGYLWAGLALLVLRGASAAGRLERYLLVAAALSLPLAAPLLVPQPYMPWPVRLGHIPELLVSNTLFGLLAVALLRQRQVAPAAATARGVKQLGSPALIAALTLGAASSFGAWLA